MPKPETNAGTSHTRDARSGDTMEEGDGTVAPLYRRVLGDAFETLPPALRRFHDRPLGGTAGGTLCVTHGKGRLRRTLAALLRLPPEGENVPLQLRVVVDGEREQWLRDFGGVRLESVQWAWQGLLVEAVGPLRYGLRLVTRPKSLRFDLARAWLYALPLPRVLAPRITAVVTDAGPAAWGVQVRVEAPLLGLLVAYEGEVTPE